MSPPLTLASEITVDEVGVRTGRFGEYHLKSAYQQIWRHRDGLLLPVAAEALARVFRNGAPVPPLDFFAQVASKDRFHVECLCRALHLHNHVNIGVPGVELFFNYDPGVNRNLDQSIRQLGYMAERLEEIGLDIRLLVCEITETDVLDRDAFVRLTAEIRRLGMRVAIDDFGAGHSNLGRVRTVEPEFVKFDGAFFRRVVEEPAALRLLRRLSDGFKADGAMVIFEGLETPTQLVAAIETGADYLQGYLLGKPAPAGSVVDCEARPIAHFAPSSDRIVRLHGGWARTTHQRG
ncbi:MAG: EAL domain-containing protein [Mesorhizobium sp.]|nr:EAL domain-containing protein [Mesorhizobium sp.]MCO5162934.1 EAL domain-containing protein [Mesorhizobium sp.]